MEYLKKNCTFRCDYGFKCRRVKKELSFSGGQVQRMGIARELYRNPELLILDEATNSLDKQTENLILESIKDLKKYHNNNYFS